MAIVWEKSEHDVHYEVRSAGHTRRLYTNGVFHSQYHPRRAFSGGIWDLLFLPALLRPAGSIRRVLLLGVGGGAVIHMLQRFLRPRHIVGVELNPVHLEVARTFFDVTADQAELIEADARQWLADYAGAPFDLIIDDLFGESGGEPVRAVAANAAWCRKLMRPLASDGLLVMNFIGNRDLQNCACLRSPACRSRFGSAFRLSLPGFENAIGAFVRQPADSRHLRQRLAELAGVRQRPDYRIRRLW